MNIFKNSRATRYLSNETSFNPINVTGLFSNTLKISEKQKNCFLMFPEDIVVMRYAIWYHLYNSKNVKNTMEALLLVKLQASAWNFTKGTLLHGCFPRFLHCTNGNKSGNASQSNNATLLCITYMDFILGEFSHVLKKKFCLEII